VLRLHKGVTSKIEEGTRGVVINVLSSFLPGMDLPRGILGVYCAA
jgi:hypothetical protein